MSHFVYSVCKVNIQLPLRSFNILCISACVWSPVELDEHQVPDLQDVGIVHVDQVGGVSPSDAVVVDLTAGTAGTGVSHLPEVILHAAWQDASLLHPERNTASREREREDLIKPICS